RGAQQILEAHDAVTNGRHVFWMEHLPSTPFGFTQTDLVEAGGGPHAHGIGAHGLFRHTEVHVEGVAGPEVEHPRQCGLHADAHDGNRERLPARAHLEEEPAVIAGIGFADRPPVERERHDA
ncbi:MAG: hypothetical protein ACK56F_03050, partial [bacterium]